MTTTSPTIPSLPDYQAPANIYASVVQHGSIAYVSGHIAKTPTEVLFTGKVGADISVEDARRSAELATLNALASLKHALGGLQQLDRIIKLTVFVASAPGFNEQPKVADAASILLQTMFGEKGTAARSAIGVAELPRNASVEVELTVALLEA
ncbi:MAG TPA: RidA family protein [Devosia sp.]|nr:RidA family protein [Devosia sp.]